MRGRALDLVSVADAQRQIETIGDREGIVGEDREGRGAVAVQIALAGVGHEIAARGDTGERRDRIGIGAPGQQQAEIAFVIAAEEGVLARFQPLVGVEDAEDRVDPLAVIGEPRLLREHLELVRIAVRAPIPDVGGGIVDVDAAVRLVIAIGGDRGEAERVAQFPVELARDAAVADAEIGWAVGVGDAVERLAVAQRTGVRRERIDEGGGRPGDAGRVDAAILVAFGPVADQPDVDPVGRADEQLGTYRPVVFIVGARAGARAGAGAHLPEAVAFALQREDAARDGIADQPAGRRAGHGPGVVIAVAADEFGRWIEAGRGGNHVDDAGRHVLAEQGRLRALQHLHPLKFAQVAEGDAAACAIDAVDDRADRAFKAGIVAHRADAADTDRGLRGRGGGGDVEARGDRLEILDVAHAGIFELLLVKHRHHDRHVLQPLFALLRGDDDLAVVRLWAARGVGRAGGGHRCGGIICRIGAGRGGFLRRRADRDGRYRQRKDGRGRTQHHIFLP